MIEPHNKVVVAHQGAPIVNSDLVSMRKEGDVVLLLVDLKSKYCETMGTVFDNNEGPGIMIAANERSLYLDETKDIEEDTTIMFPGCKDYEVFASGIGRYTLVVCLVKRPVYEKFT